MNTASKNKKSETQKIKTPISYYGGKQTMLKHLLPLIPAHKLYCEPFFGGGALFFAKQKSEVEVINDKDGEVINFYQVLKKKFPELQKEIKATLHSRELYKNAMVVYEHPELFNEVKRAWAFWTLTNQGFASMIGSWGFGKDDSKESAIANKRDDFKDYYEKRLRSTQIESNDALKVIARCDTKDSFFYVDPPYIGSDMGHYEGYTEKDYEALLNMLAKVKGKFLLSSYPSKILSSFIRRYKWRVKKVEKPVAVTKHTDKKKTEMLVMNYDSGKNSFHQSMSLNGSSSHLTPKDIAIEFVRKKIKKGAGGLMKIQDWLADEQENFAVHAEGKYIVVTMIYGTAIHERFDIEEITKEIVRQKKGRLPKRTPLPKHAAAFKIITRFLDMNGQRIGQEDVMALMLEVQKAFAKKEITEDSPVGEEIALIYMSLMSMYRSAQKAMVLVFGDNTVEGYIKALDKICKPDRKSLKGFETPAKKISAAKWREFVKQLNQKPVK